VEGVEGKWKNGKMGWWSSERKTRKEMADDQALMANDQLLITNG